MTIDTIEQDTKTLIEAIYQYERVKKDKKSSEKAKSYVLQILDKIQAELEEEKSNV